MPPRLIIALLACLALTTTVRAQSYGLASRPAFSAFNGGTLPPNASTISGTWSAVPVANWPTFSNPMGIVQEPGTQSMIVWEREGRVYRFDKATGTGKTLMLDLSSNTQGWDDCGMLNLVCHPNYATNKYVFIYYVWQPGPSSIKGSAAARPPTFMTNWKRLSRFTVKSDGTIDKASETVLVHQKCEVLWHSGSGMFFHPTDGFLYFINGDDFIPSKAQKVNGGIFSGIFRIDVDERGGSISHPIPRQPLPGPNNNTGSYTANYYIPNDNPLVGQSGVLEEYFALGVRSPHRLTYDAVTGRMFHSDVGDESREEINVVEPGEVLPNYQWPRFEGLVGDMTQPYLGLNKKPIIDYAHTDGSAVIGGYVYRGSAFPELQGKYIFGDNMNGMIWYLDESTTPASKVAICKLSNGPGFNAGDNYLGLSSFGVDTDGELYLSQLSTSGGRIYRLSRTGGNTNQMPATLSATNVFSDLANLTTGTGFIAYDVNTPLWSDGAEKKRWFAVPSGQRIGYAPTGEWSFPTGSVFVKHFDLATDETNPTIKRRLETRIIVRDNQGFVYGGTYKWRNDLSDADLVSDTQTENITITTASGTRSQTWTFPGRNACLQCHTPASKGVLGLSTPQNHRDHLFTETGITDNQLRAWNHVGYFTPAIDEGALGSLAKFAAIDDSGASVETRVRSYLDSNCAHCHRPGGVRANWDARFETALGSAGIVNGSALRDLGVAGSRIIMPQDIAKSVLHKRLATATESYAMPPLAKAVVDAPAVALIEQWINSLPASPAKPPSINGLYKKFGGTWGTGGLGASPEGDKLSLVHQTSPPSLPSDPKPETPASWYGMELVGDGYLIAHVTQAPARIETLAGMMARSSLTDGAGGSGPFSYSNANLPEWMLIGYAGSKFTSASSTDGLSWNQTQSTTTRGTHTYLGFWLSAGSTGNVAPPDSIAFDHVTYFPKTPWAYSSHPTSQLVRVGDLVEFGVETLGLPPTSYQWRKGTSNIARAVASCYAFKAVLGSAGSFNVLTGGKLASNAANLVVLDKVTYTTNLAPTTTATFTLSYAGTGATFTWTKDGVPLQNSTRIVGANTAKLYVKSLTTNDIGDYECVVSAFGTTQVMGPHHLHVLSKPTITAADPPAGNVTQLFTWQLSADEPVTTYKVEGLPAGLTYNSKTGLVSGRATAGSATTYTIKVTATNAAGAGVTRNYSLTVTPFPTPLVGKFAGLLDRDAANDNLGGSLSLSVTSTGSLTGTLVFATKSYSLVGLSNFVAGSDPTFTQTFTRTGLPALVVSLTMDRTAGTVSGNVNGIPLSARRLLTTSTAAAYNVALKLPAGLVGNVAVPQGTGWARVSVSSTAVVTVSGALADGTVLTSSHTLRDDGSFAWRQVIYSNHGSVQGAPVIAGNAFTGTLSWRKTGAASTTDYTYPGDFGLVDLGVDGVKFVAPTTGTTLVGNADAVGNAKIAFTLGGITAAAANNLPNQTFRLRSTHTASFDASTLINPNKVAMTITASTGYFTGSFYLKDGTLSRNVTYHGIFIPGRREALGAFTLRQLPGTSMSPVLSGSVRVWDSALP